MKNLMNKHMALNTAQQSTFPLLGPIFLLIQITLKGFPEGFLVRLMIGLTTNPLRGINTVI